MMPNQGYFTDSLSYTLARNSVLVTLLVAFSLSCVQIAIDFMREKNATEQFAMEILTANQFEAAAAISYLDTAAIEEVAKGIVQHRAITFVTITNENNTVLAQFESLFDEKSKLTPDHKVFGSSKYFSRSLYLKDGESVGEVTIFVDPTVAAEGVLDRSLLVHISGLVRNILLAFILIYVFYRTTTKKVIDIGSALKNLDLDNPHKNRIPKIHYEKQNELDDLRQSINRMLDRISNDIEKKEQRERDLCASQKELLYQENHDALSGLVNRRGFEYYLSHVMQNKHVDNAEHVFCYLDLDQFKIINDACGHIAGDELLRQISRLLQDNICGQHVLARLGGDEFGILMEYCNVENAKKMAQKLIDVVAGYRFIWEEKPFIVAVSIGIVPISELTINSNDLLRNADIACYAAKNAGRNCFRVYEKNVSAIAQVHVDMAWVTKINLALENNNVRLYAQKIQSNYDGNGQGLHYEVLLRMLDVDGSIVAPGVFFPAAERYHLMLKIDGWVIKNQFEYLSKNPEHLAALTLCSINISGSSITSTVFQQAVIDQLDYYNIPPEKICFEITETAAISNLSEATVFIQMMQEKGCLFALDDFGTGFSSFAYLKYLPVDYLKIDGVFVKGIVDDPIDYAMVKSIHEVGQIMGKKTVAEFVENPEIESKLKEIGIHYSQGYGIAKPCPIDELRFG